MLDRSRYKKKAFRGNKNVKKANNGKIIIYIFISLSFTKVFDSVYAFYREELYHEYILWLLENEEKSTDSPDMMLWCKSWRK